MIRLLFDFRGEIDRKTFAVVYFGVMAGAVALTLAGLGLGWGVFTGLQLALGLEPSTLAAMRLAGAALLTLAVAGPAVWIIYATIIKRMRNIGLSPWLALGVGLAIGGLEWFVFKPTIEARFFPPFSTMTPAGGSLQLALLFSLMLWPPRGERLPVVSPVLIALSATQRRAPPPRRTFGLKG